MNNTNHFISQTEDDKLLNKLDHLSNSRLDDQRSSMPWLISEGVASIGWKIPNRSNGIHLDQTNNSNQIHSNHLIDQTDNLNLTHSRYNLSNLLSSYYTSIEPISEIKVKDDSSSKKSRLERFNHRIPLFNPNSDKSNRFVKEGSNETINDRSTLLDRLPHSNSCPQLKFRFNSPLMHCLNSKKVQNRRIKMREDSYN